ncbi:MAG: hypothetical protein LPD71_08330 [Shewanella sp.]|nr:hypothetical protein [Shewanella sp.]MCF1431737.1 hypothetical protein [Shewanella sp.]MCF1438739.1 hypothetical protein [Shewanella sp.]MCF1458530.1 hypothetical protein [Shewanella sp.]
MAGKFPLLLLSLLTLPAAASCIGGNDLVEVEFGRNSSYFNHEGKTELDKLLADSQQLTDGYLLLEFSFNKQISDKKLREYNMWLAQRRIERVKDYLTKKQLPHPMITRILTAGDEDRILSLTFCEHEESGGTPLVAE